MPPDHKSIEDLRPINSKCVRCSLCKFPPLVTVESAQRPALEAALRGLSAKDIVVAVEPAGSAADSSSGQLFDLDVIGTDRPGLIHEITAVLAARGVNVEDLASECASGCVLLQL